MSEKNLKEIISELLRLGYEGTYWDFKEDYTDCRFAWQIISMDIKHI